MKRKQINSGGDNSSVDTFQHALAEMSANVAEVNASQGFPSGELGNAAEAWSTQVPTVSQTHTLDSTGYGSGGGAFRVGMALQAAAHFAAHGDKGTAQIALADARANIAAQPPSPPIQVSFMGEIHFLPSSLIDTPARLHANNNKVAIDLFNKFCAGKKKMISRLAAKTGHGSEPFLYLTQALWTLLRFKRFDPEMRMAKDATDMLVALDPSFAPSEGSLQGNLQGELRLWAGRELAELITDKCQRAGIGILAGLKQMYKKLDDDRLEEIKTAQQFQTQYQWASADEEDIND